jgi:hypothetical protein
MRFCAHCGIALVTDRQTEVDNRCLDVLRAFHDLHSRGELDSVFRLCAGELEIEDRRATIRLSGRGAEAFQMLRNIPGGPERHRIDLEPVAVRGQGLVLVKLHWQAVEAGVDLGCLAFWELDATGRLVRGTFIDLDDLLDALDELDDRFRSGEGATFADCLRPISHLQRQFSEGDIDGLHETLTFDAVIDDHRPASLGTINRETWFESIRRLRELVPYRSIDTKFHALAGDRAVVQVLFTGETEYGAEAEVHFQCTFLIREGRLARIEPFAFDRLDDALARFEELGY